MQIFNRTSLPNTIKCNEKVYSCDMSKSNRHTLRQFYDKTGCIMVRVLARNLRGCTDLHHQPYQPTEWIFTSKPNI